MWILLLFQIPNTEFSLQTICCNYIYDAAATGERLEFIGDKYSLTFTMYRLLTETFIASSK